jgi:hypothetical protein
MAFSSKTNVMIKNFHNLALFRVKNAIFSQHNIGPSGRCYDFLNIFAENVFGSKQS